MKPLHPLLTLLFLLGSSFVSHSAHAAQSLDTCAGFLDTLPTTISTQGVWCLRHDLSTNIASGNAITVATNNVTITATISSWAGWRRATPRKAMASMPPAARMPSCGTAMCAGSTPAST